jgi:hypothetical protein
MKQSMSVLTSSETNEWYTPPLVIRMVKNVFCGNIDLDPASCEYAQRWIQADQWFGKSDDGLSQAWHGNVFLNPPYGKTGNKSNQDIWARYLLGEYRHGDVRSAILLTKCVPGYVWWDNMFHDWPIAVCITRGRIKFVSPSGRVGRSKSASCFWYFGDDLLRFEEVFSSMGRIVHPSRDISH